jgi:hypothetical protein
LLRRFREIRNRSEKTAELRLGVRLKASLVSEGKSDGDDPRASRDPKLQQYRMTITEADPPSGVPRSVEAVLDAIEFGLPELADDDLLRACDRYFELLRELVEDCERRFA